MEFTDSYYYWDFELVRPRKSYEYNTWFQTITQDYLWFRPLFEALLTPLWSRPLFEALLICKVSEILYVPYWINNSDKVSLPLPLLSNGRWVRFSSFPTEYTVGTEWVYLCPSSTPSRLRLSDATSAPQEIRTAWIHIMPLLQSSLLPSTQAARRGFPNSSSVSAL